MIWAPAGYLFKIKNKKVWLLSSIPIFIVLFIIFVLYQHRSATIYERIFEFPPTSDVIILQSYDWYFADTGVTYLKFTANQSTVNQIVGRGLTLEKEANKRCNITDDLPEWWKPESNFNTVLYTGYFDERESSEEKGYFREQDFASESECLHYNFKTQEVYYSFIGID